MTQIEFSRAGEITPEMKEVAAQEGLKPENIVELVKKGEVVILCNQNHQNVIPTGIGKGLSTKVNANIGTSVDVADLDQEIEKARVAVKAGAHAIMDLSTGGDLREIRQTITETVQIPIGTVPIYQAAVACTRKKKSFVELTVDELFETIEEQVEEGVDFITVHCGVNQRALERMKNEGRVMGVVSRGGAMTLEWMKYQKQDNPLFQHFDRLVDIAYKRDVVLSLGDGFRPGAVADATDRGQIGELTQRAREKGVQVKIEGPGHVPLHQVKANVHLEKSLCHNAPFYVLGPLVTDIAPGYDHIVSAIGGALAAWAGADFLCYVTPAEHLRLPDASDVHQGVIASRIAAHAADIAKGVKGAAEMDLMMSKCRKNLDWDGQIKISIDPEATKKIRDSRPPLDESTCTMCGEFCAIKVQMDG